MLTSTGLLAHLQASVPPAKFGEPGLTPLSTAGWIDIVAISCPPKVGLVTAQRARRRTGHFLVRRLAPKISGCAFRAAALLREGSISVRLLCVMLFHRYLKFFLDLGIRMVRGPEPIRAPSRLLIASSPGRLHVQDKGLKIAEDGMEITSRRRWRLPNPKRNCIGARRYHRLHPLPSA